MQSILVKLMKDSVVRGCLLQLLYERRSEGSIPFGHMEQAVSPPGGISRRACERPPPATAKNKEKET
jgi:hypothetical protein